VTAPRAVLFDLDGTLLDTLDDIVITLDRALVALGHRRRSRDEIATMVGHGARNLVARAIDAPLDDPRVDGLLARYLDEYARDPTPATRFMPGARELLETLRARAIAAVVCTNKPSAIARTVVERTMPSLIRAVLGAGDAPRIKPDRALVDAALSAAACPASDAWFIGDSAPDVQAARAAGVRVAIFLGGYGDRAAIDAASPDATFARYDELAAILELDA
jgi:phosphoglycolate phosphatase